MQVLNISETYTWAQFAPEFALVGLAILILMADCFIPKLPRKGYALLAAVGALVAAVFVMDRPLASLACLATGFSLLLAYDYTRVTCLGIAGEGNEEGTSEFYALPLIACAGISCLTQAQDLIMLFVSMEVITLTSYVLAGYFRRNQGSVEAGVKYLVLGALSTGMLVFGIAWFFGATASFCVNDTTAVLGLFGPFRAVYLLGLALVMLGVFFKAGAAPMHGWIPDVYQGAPTPVSAFLAVASKIAGLAALLLIAKPFAAIAAASDPAHVTLIVYVMSIVAGATLLIGNLGAIGQTNVKRLLGYSSIGQAGFILIFFVALDGAMQDNVTLYMTAYLLATLAAFVAIAMVRTQRGSEEVSAFRGLGRTNPRTAFLITVAFASLAGVPLTLGFNAKLQAFVAFFNGTCNWQDLVWLLIIMIISAAAGFYYYFKVLRAMYWEKPQEGDRALIVPPCTAAVLTACAVLLIYLGTKPLLFIAG